MTDKEREIEDRHEIASIINGCLREGYCTASQLARRITQAGYGNVKQAVKEFAEQVKMAFYVEFDELIPSIMANRIDELIKGV